MVWTMPLTLMSMHLWFLSHSHCRGIPRGKGQPVKSRIRNEMDGVRNKNREPGWRREDVDLIENQPKHTCGLCHASGHNCRNCLQSRGASTSSDVPH